MLTLFLIGFTLSVALPIVLKKFDIWDMFAILCFGGGVVALINLC